MVKLCKGCGQEKDVSCFAVTYTLGRQKKFGPYLFPYCNDCDKLRSRDKWISRTYGVTADDYDKMMREQDGKCKICNALPYKNRRLDIDHDHATGEVRGLLCTKCNRGIGYLNDDISLLRRAIEYLARKE